MAVEEVIADGGITETYNTCDDADNVENMVETKIAEIRKKAVKFEERKEATRKILVETADAIDKVTREDAWGTTGTTGVSMVGGVLTVVGGALTIATMGVATPLLIAGTVVGVAGGIGGITKNILVGKKKTNQRTSAETAMENLRKLEEEFKQVVIDLAMKMEGMTPEQRTVTHNLLASTKNTCVREALKSVRSAEAFKNLGETKKFNKEAVGTAGLLAGPTIKTFAKEFSDDVLEMSAKGFGKAAGGVMIGVGALFLISDGVTITKTAVKLWKKEPDKAAEMLRELARKLEDREEKAEETRLTSESSTEPVEVSCPICWDSLALLDGDRTILSTSCGHLFCSSCIVTAINSSKSCPTCRSRISLQTCNRIYYN